MLVVGEIGKIGATKLKMQHAHRCLLKEATRTVHLQVEAQLSGSTFFRLLAFNLPCTWHTHCLQRIGDEYRLVTSEISVFNSWYICLLSGGVGVTAS